MALLKTEASLADPVSVYVRRKGFPLQLRELQFYDLRVDLYAFSPVKSLTVAVEFKLYKWRRAVAQASLYQLCSDWVFIAVPVSTVPRLDIDLLREYGIGLIAVSDSTHCRQILAPLQSSVVRADYRRTYINLLRR